MTGYEWQRIAQAKMFSQHQTCGAPKCQHKEDKLALYRFPRPELAHIVIKSKDNIARYGLAAIDHPDNLVLVHEGQRGGVDCNDSVIMDYAAHPLEVDAHMARIKEAMNERD